MSDVEIDAESPLSGGRRSCSTLARHVRLGKLG